MVLLSESLERIGLELSDVRVSPLVVVSPWPHDEFLDVEAVLGEPPLSLLLVF